MGFVVTNVALGQLFFENFDFPLCVVIPPNAIYHLGLVQQAK
jgi:hypothetical protein